MRRLLPLTFALVAAVMPAPAAAAAAAGSAGHCTIVAGPRHLIVRGTRHADVICALHGRHIVHALGGNDTIYTGTGNDVVYAGPGNDVVHTGGGNDRIYGGPGRNTLDGGSGTDLVVGGPGAELLLGGRGTDTLLGKPGADTLDGGRGDDDLSGGAGNDTLNGGPGADDLDGGPGENTCVGDGGVDTLSVWCDSQAPKIVSLAFSQTVIDTSRAAVAVTATAHITDDGAGLQNAALVPEPGPNGEAAFGAGDRISGTATDGVYQTTMYFARYTPQGAMPLQIVLYDMFGNHRTVTSAELAAAGMPSEIEQTGLGDAAGPVLVSMSLPVNTVDTSGADQALSMDMHITDAPAGFINGFVSWVSPDGIERVEAYVDPSNRVSGDATDGDYVVQVPFLHGAEPGSWTVQGYTLTDSAGNVTTGDGTALEAIADADLTIQETGIGDMEPPELLSITITPSVVDDRDGSVLVTMTATVSDDLSGVGQVDCDFWSPSFHQDFNISAQLRAGVAPVLDGTLIGSQSMPANWAQPGVWAGVCRAWDTVNNASPITRIPLTFL